VPVTSALLFSGGLDSAVLLALELSQGRRVQPIHVRAGLAWEDLGLVEIHEAFASQVLSNVDAWASPEWARKLGVPEPVGAVDWSRTNVMGGSIAIGHPFGATGARLVTQLANEMRRRGAEFGLISICAQGGMAHALVLEAA